MEKGKEREFQVKGEKEVRGDLEKTDDNSIPLKSPHGIYVFWLFCTQKKFSRNFRLYVGGTGLTEI